MNDYILESADVTNVSIDDIELTQLFAEMAVLEAMMDCYEKQLILLEYNEESAEEIIEETYGLTKYNGARESKQDKDTDNVKEMPSTQDDSDIEKRAAKNKDKRSKLIFKIKRGIHKFLQMIVLCVRKMIDEFKTLTIGLPLLKAAFDYDSYAVKMKKGLQIMILMNLKYQKKQEHV